MRGDNRLSAAWLSNGYTLLRFSRDKQTATFRRDGHNLPLSIPDVFLSGKIPPDATAELESFFEYVRKKYGL
jgi:hypothetical protein